MKKSFIYNFCLTLAALFLTVSAWAQSSVKGTVVDENGEPVIGAAVFVTGTQHGTTTGANGQFQIVVDKGQTLEISYLGYITEIVSDFSKTKIVLREDRQNIEEVVVIGYGSQKKAHLTGAVTTVDMDDVQDIVAGDLGSTLSGLMPGVSVSGGNARPGERAALYVRDVRSLADVGSQAQEPLYVIDGYIYPNDVKVGNAQQNLGAEAFSNLDPSMVESISVLKDASAAVYGARAANGVVLVTTKRGKLGAPQISYSASIGIADAAGHPDMLSANQYGRLFNIIKTADPTKISSNLNKTTDLYQLDELEAMKGLNYDLLDKYWEAAVKQKHSLNITGATERVNYFAGISYFTQDGNLGTMDYNRWNYRAGLDMKINKWLKAGLTITGDYGEKQEPNIKLGGSNTERDYNMMLLRPRYIPEEVDGKPIAAYGISNEGSGVQNYNYAMMQKTGDYKNNKDSNMHIAGNLEVDFGQMWKPLEGLRARANYSKSISTTRGNEYASEFTLYSMTTRAGSGQHLYTPVAGQDFNELLAEDNFVAMTMGNANSASDPGYLQRTMTRTDNYQLSFTADYARTFGKHSVSAMFTIEKSEAESEYIMAKSTDPYDFTTGQSNSTATPLGDLAFTKSVSGTLSYLGRVSYAYDNKYLLDFVLRTDSSTKFAPENYWGYFPSVSAGWVVSQEGWFADNVHWIDFLKIRGSFGLTGRDNLAAWQWMQVYSQDAKDGPVFGAGLANPTNGRVSINKNNSAVNRDVHWDKSYKMNIGVDWNLLNNRLGFTIEGYKEWNREMLMNLSQNVPNTVGTPSASTNLGEMDSWGIEFSVNWSDRIGKDFKYKIGINTGYGDNKVLVMDWETEDKKYYRSIQPGGRTDIGTWGMQHIGMFRSFQDIEEYFAKYGITKYMGMNKADVRPGMLIYKDVRGAFDAETKTYAGPDGIVDSENDQVQLSNRSNPYGLTANLYAEWKGISVNAQISASWGGYSFIQSAAIKQSIENENMPAFWNPDNVYSYQDIYDVNGNLLVAENRDAKYPNPAHSINNQQSSFWRIDGAQVSLRRLTLAYSLPKKWLKPLGISGVRFNVTGTNLLSLFNPYPENFMNPLSGGYGKYPTLRNWTIGLNVSF